MFDIEKEKERFLKELETPFVLKEKVEIALKSVNNQIEEMKIRYKDCERLLSMVSLDNTKIVKKEKKSEAEITQLIINE